MRKIIGKPFDTFSIENVDINEDSITFTLEDKVFFANYDDNGRISNRKVSDVPKGFDLSRQEINLRAEESFRRLLNKLN